MGRGAGVDSAALGGRWSANEFRVMARRLVIEPHENADALELARVDDYRAVVRKGEFKTGDLALYIPEAAIIPDPIIKEMGLEGRLAGGSVGEDGKKLKNRVKAIRLRGALSQGLIYKPNFELQEGRDYSHELGIEKWRPPVPQKMTGRAEPCPKLLSYTDIANIKRYPDAFKEGEEVIATEKLHGTCSVIGLIDDQITVSSKGLAAKGLALLQAN